MKCKKCGMEIGQKSLCPVCDSKTTVEPQPQPPELKIVPKAPPSSFSKEELAKIDEFLKAHPTDWNDEFDEFYEKQVFAVNYRETYSLCSHRAELFAAIREMVKDAQKISAELMLRIMEEIPKKYPEIEENEARALAREFFKGRKQIRQITLNNVLDGEAVRVLAEWCRLDPHNIPTGFRGDADKLAEMFNTLVLTWYCEVGNNVKAGDKLCRVSELSKHAWALEFQQNPIKSGLHFLTGLVPISGTSPFSGRIVSIRTEPVQSMDDVICEIETLD